MLYNPIKYFTCYEMTFFLPGWAIILLNIIITIVVIFLLVLAVKFLFKKNTSIQTIIDGQGKKYNMITQTDVFGNTTYTKIEPHNMD